MPVTSPKERYFCFSGPGTSKLRNTGRQTREVFCLIEAKHCDGWRRCEPVLILKVLWIIKWNSTKMMKAAGICFLLVANASSSDSVTLALEWINEFLILLSHLSANFVRNWAWKESAGRKALELDS
jgi:hypothetical protein